MAKSLMKKEYFPIGKESGYSALLKLLHWVMALLFIGVLVIGFMLDDTPSEYKKLAYGLHKSLGVTILGLIPIRLASRFLSAAPAPQTSKALHKLSQLMVWGLYVGMLVMAVSGLLMSAYGGHPIAWFDLITLPEFVAKNPSLSQLFNSVHVTVAAGFAVLIGLHIMAALVHHFIFKDKVMQTMLPSCKTIKKK